MVVSKLREERQEHAGNCRKGITHLRLLLSSLNAASFRVAVHPTVFMLRGAAVFLHGMHRDKTGPLSVAGPNVRPRWFDLQERSGGEEQKHAGPPLTRLPLKVAAAQDPDNRPRAESPKRCSQTKDDEVPPRRPLR